MTGELGNTGFRLLHTQFALKRKRFCHNADGQNAFFFGDFRNDRCRTCAGAAAHTRGNKDHMGIIERVDNRVAAFFRRLFADFGFSARALAVGQLFADLNFLGRFRKSEGLFIRVHGNQVDAF